MVSFSKHLIFAAFLFAPALAAPVARGGTVTARGLEARTMGDRALELGQARRSFDSNLVPRFVQKNKPPTPKEADEEAAEADKEAAEDFRIATQNFVRKVTALEGAKTSTKQGAAELRVLLKQVQDTLADWKSKKRLVAQSTTPILPPPQVEAAYEQLVENYEAEIPK